MQDFPEGRAPTVEGKGAIIWRNFFLENCMITNYIGIASLAPLDSPLDTKVEIYSCNDSIIPHVLHEDKRCVVQYSQFLSNMQN